MGKAIVHGGHGMMWYNEVDMELYDVKWNANKKFNDFELTKEERGEPTDEFDQGNWSKSDRLYLVSTQ